MTASSRPNMFLTAKYAYYNTGFILTPEGGMAMQAGRDLTTARSYGSTVQSSNVRPQMTVNLDLNSFLSGMGASHDVKYGFGWRRVNATTSTLWPGNGILALAQIRRPRSSPQVFREGSGTNRTTYVDFYVGDTISWTRTTLDVGVRYDRQGGAALPSTTAANPAFPNVRAGPGLRRLRRAVHLEQRLAARRPHLRARRHAQDAAARQLRALRRPARLGAASAT